MTIAITAPSRLSRCTFRRRLELEHLLKHCHWFLHDDDFFSLRYHGLPDYAPAQARTADVATHTAPSPGRMAG